MTYLIIGALVIGGLAYALAKLKKTKSNPQIEERTTKDFQKDVSNYKAPIDSTLSYPERLTKTKALYPFTKWRQNFTDYGMEQYTEENCNTAKSIFDNLIEKLIKLGENGEKKDKEKCFEVAVKALNNLNEKDEGIIETGEREDLCELIDQITIASGLNPKDYAEGEGIADLWREW